MSRETDGRYEYGQASSSAESDRLMEAIRQLLLALPNEVIAEALHDNVVEGRVLSLDRSVSVEEIYTVNEDNPLWLRSTRKPIRMAFMVDIVGYGRRSSPARESLQQRLADLVRIVLEEVGVAVSATDLQGTGDGILAILPERIDVLRGSAVLLRSFDERLAHDNSVFRDRMRVRMAADVGPVSPTDLGFGGAMVTKIGRMLDSGRLRRSVREYPERDLLAVLSDALHGFVVAETPFGLQENQFTRVQIRAKELATAAWLWTR